MNAMLRPLLLRSLLLLLAPTLIRAAESATPVTFSAGAASADSTARKLSQSARREARGRK